MKRMKHPLHGFHHAYTTEEEAIMRKNGWVDDTPHEKRAEVIEFAPVKRQYNRKAK